MANQQKKSGGAKKIGRNKIKCERYRSRGTKEKNKASKAATRAGKLARKANDRAWRDQYM